MNTQEIMFYTQAQESALDKEIIRRTKQARMRRAVHHDHNTKSVRANPNKTTAHKES